jgi:phosphoglycolate phosphatase
MRPRRYDLVVFDWDGTLFDSTALIARCIQQACADLGLAVPGEADARYVIGLGLADALAHVAPELPRERYRELGERYRHHYVAAQDDVALFEGTREMLAMLKARNHLLGIATGKSRRGLDDALRIAGLEGLFDVTRTADETASKPDPRMLVELMHAVGVVPERTLMVGDTTHDLQLAVNAGAHAIGVSYGAHTHDAFGPYEPRHVAHSVAGLRAWLEANA